jgi:hypothetical protein
MLLLMKSAQVLAWCVLIFGCTILSLYLEQQIFSIEHAKAETRSMSVQSELTFNDTSEHLYVYTANSNLPEPDGPLSLSLSSDAQGLIKVYHGHDGKDRLVDTNYTSFMEVPDIDRNDWPVLEKLVGSTNSDIIGDVQYLLDFAIIAHPKTATSSMQNWFRSHPEIQMQAHENHALAAGRPAELVVQLYNLMPGRAYKRGYKAPRDLIMGESLQALAKYWPKTKLIVGLRHPVLWFESFYNFRMHNGYNMPSPETLIGKLKRGMVGVATDESKFHLHLDNLGKTLRSPDELKFLSWGNDKRPRIPKMKNPVFLYEVNQLRDANETRAAIFCSDLKNYLGLQKSLAPMSAKKGPVYTKAIEICEPRYNDLRDELMKNAKEASTWIQRYFLQSPDVVVSSPKYFNELMVSWSVDPCETYRSS